MHYDFCNWLPASISGRVITTTTQVCEADENPTPVAGVTIQLIGSGGDVLKSTTTDAQGQYQFTGLAPWVQYTVHELQPVGLFENDAMAGSEGGTVIGTDMRLVNQKIDEFANLVLAGPIVNANSPIPQSYSLDFGLYMENTIQFTEEARLQGGVRGDWVHANVTADAGSLQALGNYFPGTLAQRAMANLARVGIPD